MAKAAYKKTVIAGQLRKVVRYSRALPKDSKVVRQAKQAATSAAQRYLNIKNATDRLELLFWSNFATKYAAFLTFTFDEDNLPANQKHTQGIFADCMTEYRKTAKAKGAPCGYVYTVEGVNLTHNPAAYPVAAQEFELEPWKVKEKWEQLGAPGAQDSQDKQPRLHVHCVMNLLPCDYDTIRALWPYGQVYISPIKINEAEAFPRLASYFTKESRSCAKEPGKRAYIPSRGLVQPVITGEWCSESEPLELPQGAESIKRGAEYNDTYGTSMEYLIYKLPGAQDGPKPQKVTPRRVKKKGRTGPK